MVSRLWSPSVLLYYCIICVSVCVLCVWCACVLACATVCVSVYIMCLTWAGIPGTPGKSEGKKSDEWSEESCCIDFHLQPGLFSQGNNVYSSAKCFFNCFLHAKWANSISGGKWNHQNKLCLHNFLLQIDQLETKSQNIIFCLRLRSMQVNEIVPAAVMRGWKVAKERDGCHYHVVTSSQGTTHLADLYPFLIMLIPLPFWDNALFLFCLLDITLSHLFVITWSWTQTRAN